MGAEVGIQLTGPQLDALAAQASKHVAFSLTEACPLACRHCIVSTVTAGDKSRTMSVAQAEEYAGQLAALRQRGVKYVSFTGGEPLLAAQQLALLSTAATAQGLECTVVTACHWAASDENARKIVRRFPGIARWHLSADIYHEEFTPFLNVVRAARACLAEGRQATVRMAASLPLSAQHRQLQRDLATNLPPGVEIAVQPLTKMGRAAGLETEEPVAAVPAWPCMPNAMLVRYDGTVAPCCAGLVDERDGHPFQYPRADNTGLAEAHRSWCTDPLLQLIRTVGFAPLLQWVAEEFPEAGILRDTPRHPCDCCLRLWRDPALATALRQRAERPANRAKIAALAQEIFGETFMLNAQRGEA